MPANGGGVLRDVLVGVGRMRKRGVGGGVSEPRDRVRGGRACLRAHGPDDGHAVGRISGCHLNPAVSLGLWVGGRFPAKDVVPHVVAQIAGAAAGAGVLYVIASGAPSFGITGRFATNGFGVHSPGGYTMTVAIICAVVMTAMFLMVILGATDKRAPKGFAPIAIGLALTLIHLISIPVTNTSVNPMRSTGVAIFQGGWALQQLWLFWAAPLVGALVGGIPPAARARKTQWPPYSSARLDLESLCSGVLRSVGCLPSCQGQEAG